MSESIRVTCTRDDVHAGDTNLKPLLAMAPAAATLADLITQVQPRYLPSIDGGAATWVLWLQADSAVPANRMAPLAVITQDGDRRYLVPARSPLLALSSNDALHIQFDYYAQQPVDDVLAGLSSAVPV